MIDSGAFVISPSFLRVSAPTPPSRGEPFNWKHPKLAQLRPEQPSVPEAEGLDDENAGFTDSEFAQTFVKACVHHSIVRIGNANEIDALTLMCKALLQHLEENSGDEGSTVPLPTVSAAAVREVQIVLRALLLLLDPPEGLSDLSPLDDVTNAKSGMKLLVSQLLKNKAVLQKKEVALREHVLAWSMYKKEIHEAERMQDVVALKTFLPKLPVWKKTLFHGPDRAIYPK